MSSPTLPPFIIIGENIHTSRVVRARRQPRSARPPSGQPAVRVPLDDGEALLPVSRRSIQDTREFASGRVKHVMAAVLEGDGQRSRCRHRRGLRALDGGSPDRRRRGVSRPQRRRGLARRRRPPRGDGLARPGRSGRSSTVPLSIDSSDSSVMAVGLEPRRTRRWAGGGATAAQLGGGRPRRTCLRLAAERGSPGRPVLDRGDDADRHRGADGPRDRDDRDGGRPRAALARPARRPAGHPDRRRRRWRARPTSRRSASSARATDRRSTSPAACRTCRSGCRRAGSSATSSWTCASLAGQDSGIVDPVAADIARALVAGPRVGEPTGWRRTC